MSSFFSLQVTYGRNQSVLISELRVFFSWDRGKFSKCSHVLSNFISRMNEPHEFSSEAFHFPSSQNYLALFSYVLGLSHSVSSYFSVFFPFDSFLHKFIIIFQLFFCYFFPVRKFSWDQFEWWLIFFSDVPDVLWFLWLIISFHSAFLCFFIGSYSSKILNCFCNE